MSYYRSDFFFFETENPYLAVLKYLDTKLIVTCDITSLSNILSL